MSNELPIYVMKENWWDKEGAEWLEFCHLYPNFITVRKYAGSYEPRKRPFEVVVYSRDAKIIQRVASAWYATEKSAMSAAKSKSKSLGAQYATRTETKKRKERSSVNQ